jgi:hypothetical protein
MINAFALAQITDRRSDWRYVAGLLFAIPARLPCRLFFYKGIVLVHKQC